MASGNSKSIEPLQLEEICSADPAPFLRAYKALREVNVPEIEIAEVLKRTIRKNLGLSAPKAHVWLGAHILRYERREAAKKT